MKKLVFFLFILATAPAVNAQIIHQGPNKGAITPAAAVSGCTFVQSTGHACLSGTVCSATFTATPVNGNLIVVGFVSTGENLDSTQISDKSGNTYTSTAPSAGTSSESLWAYKFAATTTSSFWVKFTGAGAADYSLTLWELSGCVSIDTTTARTIASGTPATASITTNATDVILGLLTYEGVTTTITKGATYTEDYQQADNSSFQDIQGQHKTVAAGSYTSDLTLGASRTSRISALAIR